MDIKIYPNQIKGEVTAPPSKSYLHRAIICASLSKGKSVIKNILIGDDIQQTIEAFRSLGVQITYLDNQLIVESTGVLAFKENHAIHCLESGSTMRFLIPLLTNNLGVEFHGKASLLKRPLNLYEKIFSQQNNQFIRLDDFVFVKGTIKPDTYLIDDDSSSQYISGLLFALPLLSESSTIKINKYFQSRKYIDMTIFMLEQFGIQIIQESENIFIIPGNQKYQPTNIEIESDYSQAAFFMVGAALNGNVQFNNMTIDSLQPDRELLNILENSGSHISYKDNQFSIQKSDIDIKKINLAQTIDLGPVLFFLASQCSDDTLITHYQRLKYKESNRLENMLVILNKMNVSYDFIEGDLMIKSNHHFTLGTIDSYGDHRIAMAVAIIATMSKEPTIIQNMEVINKSYPTFLIDLEQLGIKIDYLP